MGIQNKITREIFEGKYPSEMLYENYLLLLEEGFELLKKENDSIEKRTELSQLKAIRIALEYRFEVMRQFRKKQLQNALGYMPQMVN